MATAHRQVATLASNGTCKHASNRKTQLLLTPAAERILLSFSCATTARLLTRLIKPGGSTSNLGTESLHLDLCNNSPPISRYSSDQHQDPEPQRAGATLKGNDILIPCLPQSSIPLLLDLKMSRVPILDFISAQLTPEERHWYKFSGDNIQAGNYPDLFANRMRGIILGAMGRKPGIVSAHNTFLQLVPWPNEVKRRAFVMPLHQGSAPEHVDGVQAGKSQQFFLCMHQVELVVNGLSVANRAVGGDRHHSCPDQRADLADAMRYRWEHEGREAFSAILQTLSIIWGC